MEEFYTPILANALSFAFEKSTIEGKITIGLLAICSLISWTVIINKSRQLSKAGRQSKAFYAAFRETRDPLELFRAKKEFEGAPAYEVYLAGAEELMFHLEKNPVNVKGESRISSASFESVLVAMDRTGGAEALALEKGMIVLSTAVAGGPFIGLLGTVWGVMETFSGIAIAKAASLTAMAPGVAGALIATVKESRALAHVVTGPDAGKTYELPYLGKIAWENALANPFPQNKTIVGCQDDSTVSNSRVNFYIGTKANTGLDIDKAGLTGGTLYGVKLNGFTNETDAAVATNGTAFSLFSYGNVANLTGAAVEALAVANGVASFQRAEDGVWDPANPRDYYFVTTASFTGKSRLWRLRFTDIANPESGGVIDLLVTGTEGHKMLDNIGFDSAGNLILQEDTGNQAYVGRMWKYVPSTGAFFPIATFRPSLFTSGLPGFLTQDEESSGIIDVSSILGYKAMLLVAQIHGTIGIAPGASTAEIVENGQLLVMRELDNGSYSVVVSNSFGVSTSSVAGLTVTAPPELANTTFRNGLPGATVSNGGTLTLNVPPSALTGTGPFNYQWFINGVPIANANSSTLTVPGFNSSFAGNYTVQVGNAAGSSTSVVVPVSTADIAFFGGVAIEGPANAKYRLEYLSDVANTNSWTTLTNIVHTGGKQFYIDTTSSGTQRRFFRAVPTP